MRIRLRAIIACFYAILLSCSQPQVHQIKLAPEYEGVDPRVAPYVDEYIGLANDQGITFDKKVTIGLHKIPEHQIIGWCTEAFTFREIDLDTEYFVSGSELSRKMLIFHELTHCYCDRGHDFNAGKDYPEPSNLNSLHIFPRLSPLKDVEGYFPDTCPLSIMHPIHIDDFCAQHHYAHYIKEMFDRCLPY